MNILRISLASLLLVSTAGNVRAQHKTTSRRNLQLSTKPIALPKQLVGKPLISVSVFTSEDQPKATTVFRYSFRGSYKDFMAKLRRELKGWKEDSTGFEIEHRKGPVEFQAMLVNQTNLVRDETKEFLCWPLWGKPEAKGWLWISYNERKR